MKVAFAFVLASLASYASADATDDGMSPIIPGRFAVKGSDGRFKSLAIDASAATLVPELTVGPYFATVADYATTGNMLTGARAPNSGLSADRTQVTAGIPMSLTINVYNVSGTVGTELAGAQVFLWHCDTTGVYSATNLANNPTNKVDTVGMNWLRSVVTTDAQGKAVFNTIVPGWYGGRTLHFHVRVHVAGAADAVYAATSQFFFQDAVQTTIKTVSPYTQNTASYTTLASDGIYNGVPAASKSALILSLAGDNTAGYSSTFNLGIDSSKATTTAATTNTTGTTSAAASTSAANLAFTLATAFAAFAAFVSL